MEDDVRVLAVDAVHDSHSAASLVVVQVQQLQARLVAQDLLNLLYYLVDQLVQREKGVRIGTCKPQSLALIDRFSQVRHDMACQIKYHPHKTSFKLQPRRMDSSSKVP